MQDIVSEVFIAHHTGNQEKEPGAVPLNQDIERLWLADLRLLDKIVIRQV